MDTLLHSPYLGNPNDLHSFDTAHPDSPYEGFRFDTDFSQDNHRLGAHTPSYNGSYQGSPYSVLSDLPTFDPADDTLGALFTDNPSGVTISGVIPPTDDYDPSDYDYDLPSGSSFDFENFATTMGENNPSVAVTPPAFDHSSPGLDHPSPASSNGGDDDRQSRASSASSFVHPSSPPLHEFTQNFETLRFESPNWHAGNLPMDRTSPPMHKVQSPPQLVIPDIGSPATTVHDEPPTINAPDGDGMLGPQLHIVPATPISGGVGTSQNAPFLGGSVRNSNTWDQQQLLPQAGNQPLAPSNQYTNQTQHFFSGSTPSSPAMPLMNPPSAEPPTSAGLNRQQFLVPQVPVARSRSLSDTSRRPPTWNTAPMAGPSSMDTVNMNDVLPGPGTSSPSQLSNQRLVSSAGPHQTSFGHNMAAPRLAPHFSFGPPNTSLQPHQQHHNDFLSPDVPGAANLRRVKSDGNRFPNFGHRQVRSEDLRLSPSLAMTTSGPNGMLLPPPSQSSQEFIRSISHGRQFLHPNEGMVPSIANRGHHRRSSSGSRERPAVIYGSTGATRASPYPSPSASPRPGYTSLPGSDMGTMGMGRGISVDVGMGMGMGMGMGSDMGLHMGGMASSIPTAQPDVPVAVTKVNVTTPSTADASQKRRKQPANFVCPVPGCGSTFTRHFNLKGHLRSHAEEKPYQCKWPGCGKGFARQHDCKRHEQLHLNIRPYPCEGCKKNFARMDALNRHLRSEGGAECRKIQKEMKPGDVVEPDFTISDAGSPAMKHESESWAAVGVVA